MRERGRMRTREGEGEGGREREGRGGRREGQCIIVSGEETYHAPRFGAPIPLRM